MLGSTPDSFKTPPALREDLPTPTVAEDQLLVSVQASSVSPVDAFIAAGVLKGIAEHEFPVILGHDYAGVVEQVGSAVTGYTVGDEVYGWLLHADPTVRDGTWAELIAVSQDQSVARMPAIIDARHGDRSVEAAGEGPGRANVGAVPGPQNLDRLAGPLDADTLSVPIQATYPWDRTGH
jgi:alcohol dehydrogenase-like protein